MWKNNKYASNSKLYPVLAVAVEVEGIKCRAWIDNSAKSSYTSSNPINKFKNNPIQKECNIIKT